LAKTEYKQCQKDTAEVIERTNGGGMVRET